MRQVLLKTARRRVRRRDGAETTRDGTETRLAADEADDSILHAAALRGATFFSCMAMRDGDADADEAVYARVNASGASDDAFEVKARAESFPTTQRAIPPR